MFRKLKIMLGMRGKEPFRAHKNDAGADIFSAQNVTIEPHSTEVISTELHVQIPKGYFGWVASKSGLCVNHDITSEAGIIDSGYTGEIKVKLRNDGDTPFNIEATTKIAQLIIIPCWCGKFVQVYRFDDTDRGSKGFGSTGA